MKIKDYGKMYTDFITKDVSQQKEAELMAMRNDFIKRGKEALVIAIEKCVEYGNYGGSLILKDFINRSKWLLVDPSENKINEWINNNPMELHARDNKHSIENLTITMLTKYVYEYLETT